MGLYFKTGMLKRMDEWASALLGRRRDIPLSECVHYSAFQYGVNAINPYENYILGLARGDDKAALRKKFIDFVCHYRPHHLGEALGVQLDKATPLWSLPWRRRVILRNEGWKPDVSQIPDIVTHYCEQGIPRYWLEREFTWLEGAWENIRKQGYLPRRYSYVRVFELRAQHASRFLLLDGNHRISAMVALGLKNVEVLQAPWAIAKREAVSCWPSVRSGYIGREDALRIFDAYFVGNSTPYRAAQPAPLLD